MDLTWTAHERAFRDEVKEFVQAELPADIREKVLKHQRLINTDYIRWHRVLAAKGWGAPNWPVEHGGTGWGPMQRLIFEIETFKGGAPRLLPFGLGMIGPVLMKYGSKALQDRFIKRMITVEDWWCQGYSEPGAGSDLASLKTRAVKTADGYVVSGQKTWTTLAQYADWMFCLARTDPDVKPQRGISLLLIDLRQPGVTVRPIRTLDGGVDVNEVWLDEVKVPFENLVGNENEGWTYAKYLLGHERTGIAGIGHCHRELKILKNMADEMRVDGRRAIDNPRLKEKVVRIEADIRALEMLLLRVAANSAQGPGPQASMLKVRGSEIQQDLAMLQMEVMGIDGWPYDSAWRESDASFFGPGPEPAAAASGGYFDMRKTTIYGGTTEVQKTIIAKMVLSS
ncbi:acyl-CoA dehydrogenase family protein [Pusillimonas sp. ANT_WB101]|uniref:acyl-CoA dehydrogenase family protein n=1 Tax=Pusillimonas sp. ANT_WB101 TaxID=2597356 RepID=UPI0011EF7F4B|nr:acyl-CoA dehydrogenase family protein [Pusillimonas sp. ANT_WB101]KAA0910622.1 pimeloyl-CoA dehydrogenase large subunit [Pusillimonas sp. ANT_WB101]